MSERWLTVGLIGGGFAVFAVGAILYVSGGQLSLDSAAGREAYDAARTTRLWSDRFVTLGVACGAAGIAALAGRVGNAAAHAGVVLWVVAVASIAVTKLGSGEATRLALDVWRQTGEIPPAYPVVDAFDDGLWLAYVVFGFAGTALVGVGIARAGGAAATTGWAAAGVGGVGALLALVGVSFIPGWVQLPTLLLAVAGWQLHDAVGLTGDERGARPVGGQEGRA